MQIAISTFQPVVLSIPSSARRLGSLSQGGLKEIRTLEIVSWPPRRTRAHRPHVGRCARPQWSCPVPTPQLQRARTHTCLVRTLASLYTALMRLSAKPTMWTSAAALTALLAALTISAQEKVDLTVVNHIKSEAFQNSQ